MNLLPPVDPDSEIEPVSSDFAKALEEYERGRGTAAVAAGAAADIAVGSRVRGKVVHVGEETVLVDFGGRSEGAAETAQFRADDGTVRVKVGDELDLFVSEAGDQVLLAPSMKADPAVALKQVREAQAAGMPITGKVTGVNTGGLEVDLGGARGFCPLSQVESGYCEDASSYVGRSLEFLVTEVKDGRGGAVLSRRQLLRREEEVQARQMLATLKPGDELDGTVARLEAFGAFVNLGGVDGMVHVSELSHERLGHPREAVQVGQKVRVRVLRLDTGKDGRPRIALSIKATAADPWSEIAPKLAVGTRVQGKVARLADFGAFVTLAPGVDGLVHVSEVALHRVAHVKEVLSPGQVIEAVVREVDLVKKRISLSIREALASELPPARDPVLNEVVEGLVGNVKPFGVFVDLPQFGPRVSGLLPREETGEPRNADLSKAFAIGQPLRVEILEIKEGRIRLGMAASQMPSAAGAAAAEPRGAAPPPSATPSPARGTGGQEAPLTAMALAMKKALEGR
ncbi:MAG: S1 RNA-binding domain-containing protein [Candidatus Eisenbacteria bacterium]|nr:S1 RNA-binding domain-containing protein [Candidatus Eisenbacteria bacterium]